MRRTPTMRANGRISVSDQSVGGLRFLRRSQRIVNAESARLSNKLRSEGTGRVAVEQFERRFGDGLKTVPYRTPDLLDNRLHHRVLEIATELTDRFLDHQQSDELLLAIDPEVRAERAVPAEAAVRF